MSQLAFIEKTVHLIIENMYETLNHPIVLGHEFINNFFKNLLISCIINMKHYF